MLWWGINYFTQLGKGIENLGSRVSFFHCALQKFFWDYLWWVNAEDDAGTVNPWPACTAAVLNLGTSRNQRGSSKQLSSIARQSSKKSNWDNNKQKLNNTSEMIHIMTGFPGIKRRERVGLCCLLWLQCGKLKRTTTQQVKSDGYCAL